MPNEWKVILRAADGLDLSEKETEEYIKIAIDIYSEVVTDAPTIGEHEQYGSFLNNHVFSDRRLITFLKEINVAQEHINDFASGEVNTRELIHNWNQLRFTVDELIDLVMLLKLIRDYSEISHNRRIESRYRLQKLVYLVNARIRDENRQEPQSIFEGELGMLDRTGYRYQFVRRDSGPYAEAAYEDKNRLFAWNLIDEPIVEANGTGEVAEHNRRYGIELSAKGEIFVERFYSRIEESNSTEIQSWNIAQSEVINEIVPTDIVELRDHVQMELNPDVGTGDVCLSGPARKFRKNNVKFLNQLADQVENIMGNQTSGVVVSNV